MLYSFICVSRRVLFVHNPQRNGPSLVMQSEPQAVTSGKEFIAACAVHVTSTDCFVHLAVSTGASGIISGHSVWVIILCLSFHGKK